MRAYRASKAGRSIADCEDSVGYAEAGTAAALSDGASSSPNAAVWSAILVRRFLTSSRDERLDIGSWWPRARDSFESIQAGDDESGWWESEVRRRGAFATFIGFEVREEAYGAAWRAVAVGDSCLFQLRDQQLVAAFPIESGSDFTSTPELIGSGTPPDSPLIATGLCRPGDALILCSDALANWALNRALEEPSTWRFVQGLRSDNFARFIAAARETGELEDDDVALLRCEVLG